MAHWQRTHGVQTKSGDGESLGSVEGNAADLGIFMSIDSNSLPDSAHTNRASLSGR